MLVCATQLSHLALEELVLFAGARLPPVVFHVAWAQPKIASSTCSSIDLGQVNAVVQLAFTIGTLGAGAGASAVNTGGKIEEPPFKVERNQRAPRGTNGNTDC